MPAQLSEPIPETDREPLLDPALQLRQLQQKVVMLESVLNATLDPLITIDSQGKVLVASDSVQRVFGWKPQEVVGRNVTLLMPEHYRRLHDEAVATYQKSRPSTVIGVTREAVAQRKDGQEFPCELRVSQVDIPGKDDPVFTGIIRDISDLKETEARTCEYTQALESANVQLEDARRELSLTIEDLQDKNEELDRFTYVASHDLQEPLRKLISFSQLLEQDAGDALNDLAKKDLGFIVDAARRMQDLVQDLLVLSRAGRTQMRRQAVSLDECVDRALDTLQMRIEESGAVIERDPLPEVVGDETLLTQLWLNLLGNALKFVDTETPLVQITAHQEPQRWVLGVRDNGIGIDPQYIDQIFHPFRRLHGSGDYQGTGIGLAICRKAIERHEGEIWVESILGEGAHFKFTLPTTKGSNND